MKSIRLSYLGASLLMVTALASCQDDFDAPGIQEPVATWQANTTIAGLKEAMWKDDTNYAIKCPQKEDGSNYIIKGRVISSDASGNIYKSLYLQDATGAITISINQNSIYNQYRVGQEVVMDVTGLYIGKYAGLEQIGGYGEYNGTPQVSFMIYPQFEEHTQLNGLPSTDLTYINYGEEAPAEGMYCTVMKISDLPTDNAGIRAMQSQLVELRNVHFEQGGENTYSTYQTSENRNLVDEAGNTIVVRTSGYSTFYNQTLPKGTGTVRAMLSYFNGTWQLLLRSTADVMFGGKGQKDEPYTVSEALGLQDTGAAGWVKGYIVGAVKGGVSAVTSNEDIIWGKDVDMDNNLVIGETADTRDYTQCVVVELKSGSAFRNAGNLLDNPGVYGKAISCRGTFARLLGMGGVTGNAGTTDEFTIEGVDNPNPPVTDAPGALSCDFEEASKIADYTAKGWKLAAVKGNLSGWYIKTFNNNNFANVSAYLGNATGGPYENWLITPAIDLSKSEKKVLSFDSQAAYAANDSYLEVYVMTTDNPASAQLTKLSPALATPPASGYSDWVKSGEVDLSAFSGIVYVGFKYYSAAGGKDNSATYAVDNVVIGKSTGGSVTPDPDPTPGPTPDLQDAVVLKAADAANFDGEHHAEEPKEGSSNGQAERWQPLRGFTIGDYAFTFTSGTGTATAWYNIMSTATSGTPTVRFYNGSGMTIKVPSGKVAKIVMKGSNANSALAPTADAGTVARDGNTVTWTSTTGVSSVTFAFNATYRVNTFEVYLVK